MTRGLLFLFPLFLASLAFAEPADVEATSGLTDQGFSVEYLSYEDRIYSQSRKTLIGEQVELDAAFRYRFSPDTFSRFRFEIDPQEDSLQGKTNKFEFLVNHISGPFVGQLDLDFRGNDGKKGGLAIGPDNDSEGTFVSYQANPNWRFTFYPYNFDGEVGDEFNTWDVTRIHYITDLPSALDSVQTADERVVARTIPGVGVDYGTDYGFTFSAALGVATYLYPGNPDFDVANNRTTNWWERREDIGWRASVGYNSEFFTATLAHVTHDSAAETGSLLASATALEMSLALGQFTLESEIVQSEAGPKAYHLNEAGDWFKNPKGDYEPVYSDFHGNRHDWLGQSDQAAMLKLGYKSGNLVPYLSYKWQGEHFVYRELESAHLLRTYDERRSHGGLQRIGLGAHIFTGELEIQPEIEWMQANNRVFGTATSIALNPASRIFANTDLLLSIVVKYAFDDIEEARY